MRNDTPSAAEALLPHEKSVIIGGEVYTMRRLKVRQLMELTTLSAGMSQEARARIMESAAAGTPDFAAVAGAMDPDGLVKMMGIVLDRRDPEDLARYRDLDVEELSELSLAFTQVHDIKKLVSNFRQTAERFKPLLETPSQPSSEK